MVALEAVLDTRQMVSGAARANSALRLLQTAAAGTEGSLRGVSMLLLDISRSASAFSGISGTLGAIGSVVTKLTPALLIASTAISAITLGMALFESNTKNASSAIEDQIGKLDRLAKAIPDIASRARFGAEDRRRSESGILDTLVAFDLDKSVRSLRADRAARLFGVDEQRFREAAAIGGVGESALLLGTHPISGEPTSSFARNDFSRNEILAAGRQLLEQQRERDRLTYYQRGSQQPNLDSLGLDGPRKVAREPVGPFPARSGDRTSYTTEIQGYDIDTYLTMGRDRQRLMDQQDEERVRLKEKQAKLDAKNARMAKENMDRLIESGQRFGETIGDAVADLALGLGSARQIMAALVADFARSGIRNIFGQIGGAIAGGFGTTQTQAAQNSSGFSAGNSGLGNAGTP